MTEPGAVEVSWKAIEENADVVSSAGERIGKVTRTVGDADADIFTGLAISVHALGSERFVPSERVRAIWPGRVEVDVANVEHLPDHEETPTVRWRPRRGVRGLLRRFLGR